MEGRAAEDVFKDFRGRRAGLIKALTTDVRKFYDKCNPADENLCLYGLPNGSWEVNLPVDEVPPELPEPALGINFARDGMPEEKWVSLIAVHSDSWLISVAFYFGARFSFDKHERMRLFKMINDLPTIFEVVTGKAKQSKDQSANSGRSKSTGVKTNKASKRSPPAPPPREESESGDDEEGEEDEEGQGEVCGVCGDNDDGGDEFWIWCDTCERWFHGKCVKITPARAEHIKHYKCPSCCDTNKKRRA